MSDKRRAWLARKDRSERLGDHLAMAEASAGKAKPGRPATARRRPAKAADEESAGLECRACGCRHFEIVSTRRAAGRIILRHECRHCGRVMTTVEGESGDSPPD